MYIICIAYFAILGCLLGAIKNNLVLRIWDPVIEGGVEGKYRKIVKKKSKCSNIQQSMKS